MSIAASDFAESRDAYRDFCKICPSLPLFHQAWLLDAMVPESWGAVIAGTSTRIDGVHPFPISRRFGIGISSMPTLVPRLGPWVSDGNLKVDTPKLIGRQHKILESLADQIPPFGRFVQNWNPEVVNWLPYRWHGFTAETRYTYRIEVDDLERVWRAMDGSVRTEVRKATERHGLEVRQADSLNDFIRLNEMVFSRQGMQAPHGAEEIVRFDSAVSAHANRAIFGVYDEDGRHHAGCYVVWDASCAYYLMGGSDPVLRNSGAGTLALWAALQFVADKTRTFDFEGSMIKPIERAFRAFGGSLTPYQCVSRTASRAARTAMALR